MRWPLGGAPPRSRSGARMHLTLLGVAWLAADCPTVHAAGGLWALGNEVDTHPATVFVMFLAIVGLTVSVELLKHHVEHKTVDPYRIHALESLYEELMLLGVVSFFLVLAAELGLTGVQFGCDSTAEALRTAAASGSGSKNCDYGFDIAMFQFSHLVLFSMGLFHFIFVQLAFYWRDKFAEKVREIQRYTPSSWGRIEETKRDAAAEYARRLLHIRSAMIIEYGMRMEYLCDNRCAREREELAELDGEPKPPALPSRRDARKHFDFAKYVKLMYSEMLLDLIHPPVWVWLAGLLLSLVFLAPMSMDSLSGIFIVTCIVAPVASLLTWWRITERFKVLSKAVDTHPNVGWHEFNGSTPHPAVGDAPNLRPDRKEPEAMYPFPPWNEARGRMGFSLGNDGHRTCLQISIFCNCFYLGQLCFLTPVVWRQQGAVLLAVAWLVPLLPFAYITHQAMRSYTLVFLTCEPTLANLRKTLQDANPHNPPRKHGHGHGHGEHDTHHSGGHGHDGSSDPPTPKGANMSRHGSGTSAPTSPRGTTLMGMSSSGSQPWKQRKRASKANPLLADYPTAAESCVSEPDSPATSAAPTHADQSVTSQLTCNGVNIGSHRRRGTVKGGVFGEEDIVLDHDVLSNPPQPNGGSGTGFNGNMSPTARNGVNAPAPPSRRRRSDTMTRTDTQSPPPPAVPARGGLGTRARKVAGRGGSGAGRGENGNGSMHDGPARMSVLGLGVSPSSANEPLSVGVNGAGGHRMSMLAGFDAGPGRTWTVAPEARLGELSPQHGQGARASMLGELWHPRSVSPTGSSFNGGTVSNASYGAAQRASIGGIKLPAVPRGGDRRMSMATHKRRPSSQVPRRQHTDSPHKRQSLAHNSRSTTF